MLSTLLVVEANNTSSQASKRCIYCGVRACTAADSGSGSAQLSGAECMDDPRNPWTLLGVEATTLSHLSGRYFRCS